MQSSIPTTEDNMVAYVEAPLEDGNPALVAATLGLRLHATLMYWIDMNVMPDCAAAQIPAPLRNVLHTIPVGSRIHEEGGQTAFPSVRTTN